MLIVHFDQKFFLQFINELYTNNDYGFQNNDAVHMKFRVMN